MSTDRLGGWVRHLFRTVRHPFGGVADGGVESAAVGHSPGTVRLQLTVWEQRL